MKAYLKSSWLGVLETPAAERESCAITMPFRDITYGSAARPATPFSHLIYHYANVQRKKYAAYEPTIYPTSDTYLVFSRTPTACKGYVAGPRTRPRAGEYVTDDTNFFVVSLSYIGSYAFLPIPQHELTDKSFALEDVFPGWGRELTHRICEAGDINSKIKIFEAFLAGHMAQLNLPCKNFMHVINKLSAINSYDNYLACIKSIGYTERHIRRIFLKYTGVTPYKFTRILRCQTAMKTMMANPHTFMADLACALNFCDQAHFTKEFKAFYDFTPKQFVTEFLAAGLSPAGEHRS